MIKSEVGSHVRAQHGGPHSVPGGSAGGVVDFSTNAGPLRTPRVVVAALWRAADTAFAYPDPDAKELCAAIARRHRISAKSVIAGNGATEIIYEYCRAFLGPKTHVLVQAPTFAEYASAARLCGARVSRHRTMDVAEDAAGFISRIPKKGCVFLCNPNNPTGALVARKLVLEIADTASKRGSQLFVDECFAELCPRDESVIGNVRTHDNLFVVRSFTKLFGIPGVRIGYGVGPVRVTAPMNEARVPWSVSGLGQSAGIAALGCRGHAAKSADAAAREVDYLYTAINAMDGMSAMPSMANFVLARSSRYTGAQIRSRLLKKGMLVRDCSSFEGLDPSFIRIGVRSHRENAALVRMLGSL